MQKLRPQLGPPSCTATVKVVERLRLSANVEFVTLCARRSSRLEHHHEDEQTD